MCHLSLTPRTYWEVISDRQRTGPRESHPSEDLSELPPLRDPATRWFPNVMDYSDLKQGCGWTGVPLCPFPVMAAPGAARFLQAAVTRSSVPYLMARLLNRLLLIALAKGKLPMNEYAVVKVQVKEEHSKECLSPIVLKPQGCQPCAAKYFLSLAIARFMDLATA